MQYGYLVELYESPRFSDLPYEVRFEQLGAILSHYMRYAATHGGAVAPHAFPSFSMKPLRRRRRRSRRGSGGGAG